jgi:hypothetical protein
MKVKFYYSSKDKPGEQYPNNNEACVAKIKALKSRGADAEAVDVAGVEDVFRLYHAALTGPPATVGCEKALDDLTKELAKMPTTEDEEDQPVAR